MDIRAGSVLGRPAGVHLQTGPSLEGQSPGLEWGGFPSGGAEKQVWVRRVCQQGLQACLQPVSGRAALMSDPLEAAPTAVERGSPHSVAQGCCPAWPALGPCQPLQS